MKQLLIKEYKLTSSTLTFLFLLFSTMTMLPGYPILVGPFFICLGIFYTFQFAREYNDVVFTTLLPVAKSDVVRARFAFVVSIQVIGFFLCGILTLIRMCCFSDSKPYIQNPLMNANLIYLGGVLVIFALFNLIFITGFFKTAFYYGKPLVWYCIGAFIFIGIMETLHHIPGLSIMNTCGWDNLGIQVPILFTGIAFYVIFTLAALKKSISLFEEIDLSF